ncbi:MAG: peptidoglycan-binding protein [Clostridia bacterium]|nr:peptidoglycan-binding protein [Clostridia bacterium]MBR6028405.1 peptidoglycan-binding protein [Clostridia bacterium]
MRNHRCTAGSGIPEQNQKKSEFTAEVRQAVIRFQADHGLECTGWMDDETLDALLYNILPDESSKFSAERWDDICFVPTDGGRKYHADPTCSGMYNPRMISRVNAERLGIDDCHRGSCGKGSPLTYTSLGLTPRRLPDEYYIAELSLDADLPDDTLAERSLPADDPESVYVGNRKSHVFHRASCSSALSMSEKNRVAFSSRDEAIAEGYTPCGRCNP